MSEQLSFWTSPPPPATKAQPPAPEDETTRSQNPSFWSCCPKTIYMTYGCWMSSNRPPINFLYLRRVSPFDSKCTKGTVKLLFPGAFSQSVEILLLHVSSKVWLKWTLRRLLYGLAILPSTSPKCSFIIADEAPRGELGVLRHYTLSFIWELKSAF